MKKTLIIVLVVFFEANAFAQLSTNEKAISLSMMTEQWNETKTVMMPILDMDKIEAEDKEDEKYDIPPRFGYPHKVKFDLKNSGTWYELPNGDKIWQLNVVCPGALSVNFCYDKFWIPQSGKFFVYSKDRNHCIGAFTSKNNKGDSLDVRGFATGLVYGNDIILEYYQPKEVTSEAIISIEYVVHGYRYICLDQRLLGSSCSYMVNVNCEEGENWQNEKKAVAMIIVNGYRYCTGSLIITTDLSQKPYFLTADHCLGGWANNYVKHDAYTLPNLDHYSFYWNYEAPGCANVSVEPSHFSTSGATVLANNTYSDFALLRLTEDPKSLTDFTPYYLGWDCSGEAGNSGVCIHHPKGDVKKISTVKNKPMSTYWHSSSLDGGSHWKVAWKTTTNGHGVTQGGSSGSPLLTAAHKVIGQLHGSNCDDCNNLNGHSWYGKFDVSWSGNCNDTIQRRLNCWLDSLNIGVQVMEGLLVIPSDSTMNIDQQLFSNIRITSNGQLTILSEIELMGNSSVIIEPGGKLIINGGMLSNVNIVLKPGASLQIKNNGILNTRNGLIAPVGAIVNVEYGQIL